MLVTRKKYQDALNTISFQEHQIESLAKQLRELKRQPRSKSGQFVSAREFADNYGADQ